MNTHSHYCDNMPHWTLYCILYMGYVVTMESSIKDQNENNFLSSFPCFCHFELYLPFLMFLLFPLFFTSSTRPLSCWNDAAKLPIYISKCEERNSVMSSPSPPPAVEETLCETNWNWHRCVWGEDLWGLQEYFFTAHFLLKSLFSKDETYIRLN